MASLKPCGTEAAYRRHLRNDESPCLACRRAKREADARRRRASGRAGSPPERLTESHPNQPPRTHQERLETLAGKLWEAIEKVAVEDPSRLPGLAREYRETLAGLAAGDGEKPPAEPGDEYEAALRQRQEQKALRVVQDGARSGTGVGIANPAK